MIAERRRAPGRPMSPGWSDRAVRAGVGRAGDPARIADDDRPAVAGRSPPTARPTRSAGARSRACGVRLRRPRRPRASSRQARTSGSAAIASSRPARSVVRGTIESSVEVLRGRVVVAADRAEAVEAGHAEPGRRVGVGRAAGRRVGDLEAERSRDGLGVARPAARCARASPSATSGPSARSRPSCPGPRSPRRSAGSRPRRSRARRGPRGPDVDLERAPLGDDVRARPAGDDPDVDGDARPAAVERRAGRSTIRAASRIALRPFSGSTPGVRGPAVDRRSAGRGCPCAPRRCRRSRGRIRGRARRRMSARDRRDVRRRGRRADLLVRVGHEDEPLEGQAAALGDDRLERVQPGQQPGLHVGDARAVGDAVLDPERALGRGPRVEDRVHVADQQGPRPAGPAVERGDDRAPSRPAGSGRRLDASRRARSGSRRPSARPRRRRRACSSRSRC